MDLPFLYNIFDFIPPYMGSFNPYSNGSSFFIEIEHANSDRAEMFQSLF